MTSDEPTSRQPGPALALRRALITGASGFVGSCLARRLRADGVEVFGLARSVPPTRPEIISADVRSPSDLSEVFRQVQPTHVFHLAASRRRGGSLQELPAAIAVNTLGTVNVVAAAAITGCRRVIVLGTAEEYGNITAPFAEDDREHPRSPYGISKLAATRAALAAGALSETEVTVLRATVAYGAGQLPDMFMAALLLALNEGRPFPMTQGDQTRDFIYIDDLVEALMRAATASAAAGLIVNIGSGESVTIKHVADIAERITGSLGLLQFGAVDLRQTEATSYSVDLSRAGQILDWGAVRPLEQGIAETVKSMAN